MSVSTSRSHAVCGTVEHASKILLGLGSELALVAHHFLSIGNDAALIDMSVDPSGYTDWREFFKDYQAVELLSKFDKLNLPVNRETVAIDKFLQCEQRCSETNRRFAKRESGIFPDADVYKVFHLARKKISRALGNFSWDSAVPSMAFGPGASIGLTRKKRHAVYKFGLERPTVTGECATLAEILVRTSPQWSKTVPVTSGKPEGCFSVVRGSRVTTVPKSAKTDRVIAIEPLMNMYVQKGIGSMIRNRLRRVGIDLDSQKRNQEAARKGSIDGSLATIDLSSASDTIAMGLVEWLLPSDWVLAMKVCRTKSCTLPSGEEILLRKFSSMGNGFTFELESLIFWGLSKAVIETLGESSHEMCVYGDDIIVPVTCCDLLFKVILEAGFIPNPKKTFSSGPFRESCGKHYFQGHDVTPLYIRKDVRTQERKLWLANGIKRLAYRMAGFEYGLYGGLKSAYSDVVLEISRVYQRLSIPDGVGDGGLVRDFDESRPARPRGKFRGWQGYEYQHVQRTYESVYVGEQPALTAALAGKREYLPSTTRVPIQRNKDWLARLKQEASVPIDVKVDRFSYKIVKSVAPLWGNLGPWLGGL